MLEFNIDFESVLVISQEVLNRIEENLVCNLCSGAPWSLYSLFKFLYFWKIAHMGSEFSEFKILDSQQSFKEKLLEGIVSEYF